jgi:hypothetical protein
MRNMQNDGDLAKNKLENLNTSCKCEKCGRDFNSQTGLRRHAKVHINPETDPTRNNPAYNDKRRRNTEAVQKHRKQESKMPFGTLVEDTTKAFQEALLLENVLQEQFGFL